jgi:SAM-dependent methyltransferase
VAADLHLIGENLCEFYDFQRKSVIAIGAARGALIQYARRARFVIAVDKHDGAINRLRQNVCEQGLGGRFFMFVGNITAVPFRADVVLFEFSLHEISNPRSALEHARRLAPEMVIIDHAPGSRWSWYAGEDDDVAAGWAAVPPAAICRERTCETFQRFGNYLDVKFRMRGNGAASQARIAELQNARPIVIPMPLRLAVIDSRSVTY